MTLTAEQIAKKMGISNATVSRVLNNNPNVSSQTREAVLAMVRQSGSPPRILGRRHKRNLPTQLTTQSGLVEILMLNRFPIQDLEDAVNSPPDSIPHTLATSEFFTPQARLATSFMRHIVNGIIDELRHYNLRAVVQVCDNLTAPSLLSGVNDSRNRGLFLLGLYGEDVHNFLAQCRCPIVTYMTWQHRGWPDYIGIDNYAGIRLAFDHLHQLGHTKIGYMVGQLQYSLVFQERLHAFKSCLQDANLPFRPEWTFEGSCQYKDMEIAAEAILRLPDRPTAMLCCFDGAAVAVKRAADRIGLQVPRDLSIVGFDDLDIAQLMTPALTTVRVPTTTMGRHGVHLMLLRQQIPVKPGEAFNIRETPTLIVRQSTAAPPPASGH